MKIGLRHRRAGVLDRILIPKRAEIARMLSGVQLPPRRRPGGQVIEALVRPEGAPLRLIAEVKRRSPSAGELSQALSPPERAVCYARAGARMISVLTDAPFFGGSFDHLAACRDALDEALGPARPRLLCKEFILDPIQLDRALDAGADAALLIARILTPDALVALSVEARARGIEPLVEVASEEELDAAKQAGARLIGVNARDLNTLKMDGERAARILGQIEREAVAIHLSGLASPDDVTRVAFPPALVGDPLSRSPPPTLVGDPLSRSPPSTTRRADAALIGEALMRQDDPSALLSAMVRAAAAPSDCGP
jgi:indole-3-glycerol phosphate synthase